MQNSKKSSIEVGQPLQGLRKDQFAMPTIGLISVLIVALIILKIFLYIKDTKRDNK